MLNPLETVPMNQEPKSSGPQPKLTYSCLIRQGLQEVRNNHHQQILQDQVMYCYLNFQMGLLCNASAIAKVDLLQAWQKAQEARLWTQECGNEQENISINETNKSSISHCSVDQLMINDFLDRNAYPPLSLKVHSLKCKWKETALKKVQPKANCHFK